jgi:hypothetical protein
MRSSPFLLVLLAATSVCAKGPPAWLASGEFRWSASRPLVAPEQGRRDPCHAIKDPTLVQHDDRWHVFASIKCASGTFMESLSFGDWKEANAARRHVVKLVDSYHCAPQVFYFRPQKRWYLIYQWADKANDYFGPAFSRLDAPDKPQSLTPPKMLYAKKPENVQGWLDFWVICDDDRAYLFFTSLNGLMWRAETKLDDFPHEWSEPKVVLKGDIFEASHTYRLQGLDKYLTVIEAQGPRGSRYYKAYLADRLDGEWKPLADSYDKPFAGAKNVTFADGVEPWSDSVSHGELVRAGVDETLTVDPARFQFVFQGCSERDRQGKGYGAFPWRLGMLTQE